MRSLQEEFRWSLTKYALLPVLFLMTMGFILVGMSWKKYVVDLSDEKRMTAVEVLATEIHDYEDRARYVADLGLDPLKLQQDGAGRAELYAYLYHEVNIEHEGTKFFLLNEQTKPILSNDSTWPEHLLPLGTDWGVLRRLKQQEGPCHEFILRQDGKQDLAVGCSLRKADGSLQGYMIFLLPAEYLQRNISSPYLDFVLEDQFGNACLQTGRDYMGSSLYKLALELHGSNHELASFHKQYYYVTSEKLSQRDFKLYTIMPVSGLLQRYVLGIGILFGVLLIFMPILLISIRRESRARVQAVAGEEARAMAVSEVRRLESQFNPHFLFNTLENIKFMVKLDPTAAQRMLMDLSRLLRYSIKGKERFVELSEDLAYTHNYIEIQKYRFGKRLFYQEDIDESVFDCCVPKLIFQPVIENAIRYGVSPDGTIHVMVQGKHVQDTLQVIVRDQGPGLPEDRLEEIKQMLVKGADPAVHTGIYNIHRRLRLMYGTKYGLTICCPPSGGMLVTLNLPLEKREENDAAHHHGR